MGMEAENLVDAVRWFVIARGGDLILRVCPDMRLGENSLGDLSILESDGLIVFDTDDEGDLILRIDAPQHRFALSDGSDSEVFRLQPGTRATIQLSSNTLRIDNDFGGGTLSNEPVRLTVVAVSEGEAPAVVAAASGIEQSDDLDSENSGEDVRRTDEAGVDAEAGAESEAISGTKFEAEAEAEAGAKSEAGAEAEAGPRPDAHPPAASEVAAIGADEERERSSPESSPRRRRPSAAMIAGTVLFAVAVGGLYTLYGSQREPSSAAAGAGKNPGSKVDTGNQHQIPTTTPTPTPTRSDELAEGSALGVSHDGASTLADAAQPQPLLEETAPAPPLDLSLSQAEMPVGDGPEVPVDSSSLPVPDTPRATPDPVASTQPAASAEPVTLPESPGERPQAQTESQQLAATRAAADPEAAPVPEATERAEAEIAAAAASAALANLERQRTLERDLAEAAEALESGRLLPPTEPNALSLYGNILQYAPRSEAAIQGLQQVRAATLDRVRAFLELDDLEAAVAALGDAEKAGADPLALEQLRAEVADRQRVPEAAGNDAEDLYPISQLTVIRMDPPRYPRRAPPGAEASIRLRFTVTEQGEVRDVELEDDANGAFERAARRAVERWRFEPVRDGDKTISVRTAVTVEFRDG